MAQRPYDASELNKDAIPVRLTTRPWCKAIVGSIRPLRSARSLAKVRSGELAVSGYVRRKDGCELPGLWHGCPSLHARLARLVLGLDRLFIARFEGSRGAEAIVPIPQELSRLAQVSGFVRIARGYALPQSDAEARGHAFS